MKKNALLHVLSCLLGTLIFIGMSCGANKDLDRQADPIANAGMGKRKPKNIEFAGAGLMGNSSLVQSDGDYLYAVNGSNTLITFQLCQGEGPQKTCHRYLDYREGQGAIPPPSNYADTYHVKSVVYLPARVTQVRVAADHLFLAGAFGLYVYRCADLQTQPSPAPIAIRPDPEDQEPEHECYSSVDVKEKNDQIFVAVTEYRSDTEEESNKEVLQVRFYTFDDQRSRLDRLWSWNTDIVRCEQQDHLLSVAIDPDTDKLYLGLSDAGWCDWLFTSGFVVTLPYGVDGPSDAKLEVAKIGARRFPHRIEALPGNGGSGRLWIGVAGAGVSSHLVYRTNPERDDPSSIQHLVELERIETDSLTDAPQDRLVSGGRLAVLDQNKVVLMHNSIDGQAVGLIPAMGGICQGDPQCHWKDYELADVIDWPYDVAAVPSFPNTQYTGRVFVADEWGGLSTLPLKGSSPDWEFAASFGFRDSPDDVDPVWFTGLDPEYHIPVGGAGNGSVCLTEDRTKIYTALRGAGVWGIERFQVSAQPPVWSDLGDPRLWKWIHFNWDQMDYPSPYFAQDVRAKKIPGDEATYVVARASNKSRWSGQELYGVLYKDDNHGMGGPLTELGASQFFIQNSDNTGDIVWPDVYTDETGDPKADLLFMTINEKGVYPYIINPDATGRNAIRVVGGSGPGGCVPADDARGWKGCAFMPDRDSKAVALAWVWGHNDASGPALPWGTLLVGFEGSFGLHKYQLNFDEGVPHRDQALRRIFVQAPVVLQSFVGRQIVSIDVAQSQDKQVTRVVVLSRKAGIAKPTELAVFDLDDIDAQIDLMGRDGAMIYGDDWSADGWPAYQDVSLHLVHASFDRQNPEVLYVLNDGLWRFRLRERTEQDQGFGKYKLTPEAYYPESRDDYIGGVTFLEVWRDPTVPALHNPKAVVADGQGNVFVSNWVGNIQQLRLTAISQQ